MSATLDTKNTEVKNPMLYARTHNSVYARHPKRNTEIGHKGQMYVAKLMNAVAVPDYHHPFDILFVHGARVAVEVKTMYGDGVDLKVHIAKRDYTRKIRWAKRNNMIPVLMVLILKGHTTEESELYMSDLVRHIRPHQMKRIG